MLEPMRARLASSCSRNGISAVADRHHLARRDVHVVDLGGRNVDRLAALGAHEHALFGEGAVGVQRRVGLRDDELGPPRRR
jgi:hypothetical protein